MAPRAWWLAACLLVPHPSLAAGESARCAALVSQSATLGASACWCDEPLDTNVVDLKDSSVHTNVSWPASFSSAVNVDPTDSQDVASGGHECPGQLGTIPAGYVFNKNIGGTAALTAASQAAFLPSGNSLSFVIEVDGNAVGEFVGPGVSGTPGTTYCIRSYIRWDSTSDVPNGYRCHTTTGGSVTGTACPADGQFFIGSDTASCGPDANNCGDGVTAGCNATHTCPCCYTGDHEQAKVQSIAGYSDATHAGYAPQIVTNTDYGGSGNFGRFEGNTVRSDLWTNWDSGTRTMGLNQTSCVNNFCRIESCLDHYANGTAQTRARISVLPPGTFATTTPTVSSTASVNSNNLNWTFNFNSLNVVDTFSQIYSPGGISKKYFTHLLFTKTHDVALNNATDTFWPGCDSAVEGPTCVDATGTFSGAGTTGLARWKHAFIPWLREKLWGHALEVAWR